MTDPQHERYEQQLKANADKAFDELDSMDDAAQEQAKAAHAQLLNWLVQMDRICQSPDELADDALANAACNALEQGMKAQLKRKDDKWGKLIAAFGALDDDDQLNLMRFVLSAVFKGCAKNVGLFSRQSGNFLWENTGFHLERDLRCAFAKLGDRPFQAIGFDDGERHIGTEGSKLLWSRDWALALLLPWVPPFEVTREELEELAENTISEHLTDVEREKIEEILGYFDYDLTELHKLKPDDKDKRAELDDKIRETIKLARLRLPRLDQHCDAWLAENPEYGANFESLEASQLLVTMQEYLRMLLDNDQIRRDIQQTVLAVGDVGSEQLRLIDTLMDGVSAVLPKEGESVDGDLINQRLDEASHSLPAIKELLLEMQGHDPAPSVLEAAKAVLLWLQKEKDKLIGPDTVEAEGIVVDD